MTTPDKGSDEDLGHEHLEQDLGCPVAEHGQTGMLGDIANFLIGAELLHHEKGWDNSPPMFYLVCDKAADTAPPDIPFEVAMFPLGMVDHPRDELRRLAESLKGKQGQELLSGAFSFPPVSCFVVMEAWERVVTGKTEDEEKAERAGRMLADIPGSFEIRMAFAVVDETLFVVRRKRGEEPRFTRSDLDSEYAFQGAMVESLRDVDLAVSAAFQARA